jgi:hypothetical protein
MSSVVVASSDQVGANLDGETVLLGLKDGVYYGLNPVGARIWSLLEQPSTVAEIRDRILAEYVVAPERCERDLLALLERLAEHGLVVARNDAPAR